MRVSDVPAENLLEYQLRRDWARRADSLGDRVSGIGGDAGKGLANALWALGEELREHANSLRAQG